jgi:MFS family permease
MPDERSTEEHSVERPATGIPRPVWFLGWTSLFTDAATEIIYPLLPIYLSRVLGAGAASLGIIEGVAEGVNSLLKVASGWWSDRRGRRVPLVILGYSLSGAARPLIAAAGTWVHVLLIRALDRTGKGIRGAPRDALLAQFADASSRGRIFGFHRAMDHTGAIVGPLVATAFLYFLPGQYRLLFALTAIPGVIAVVMLFLVREPDGVGRVPRREDSNAAEPTSAGNRPLPGRLWAVLSGESVTLHVGRRVVRSHRPEAGHRHRVGGLCGGLHRLCNRVDAGCVRVMVPAVRHLFRAG